MSVSVSGSYKGGLGVELLHGPSGAKMSTAAPVDNQGDGSSFSPTDMVAAGLGACMLTMIAIVGERDGLTLDGLSFRGDKHMAASPRRIERVDLVINMPPGLKSSHRRKLEKAALTCPVKNTLDSSVGTPVKFEYPD
jgi:putative redox protein